MYLLSDVFCGNEAIQKSGVYKLSFIGSGNFYIGSAVNFYARWSGHKNHLLRCVHKNDMVQKAWAKYGAENLRFDIFEIIPDKTRLIEREQFWIDSLNPAYNICRVAGSQLGRKHTDEAKRKVSEAGMNRKKSPETIKKWVETMIRVGGWKKSQAWIEKRRQYVPTQETRDKMSAILTGRKMSPEWRQKMSDAHKRNPRKPLFFTSEMRAKISEASKRREAEKKKNGYVEPEHIYLKRTNALRAAFARRREQQLVLTG